MRLLVLGLLMAVGLAGPQRAALAADLGDVQPLPEHVAPQLVPALGQGAGRHLVQLVWNSRRARLERRVFEVFDPFAARDYDLFWEPVNPDRQDGRRAEGQGVLTWREAGALRYGRESIVAQYRGMLVSGRPEGPGSFVERSGLRYDGAWRAGLMHGQGAIRLPGGDSYAGAFREGRIDGTGIFVAATGETYQGGFRMGARHGAGEVRAPDGAHYSAVWSDGLRVGPDRPGGSDAFAMLHRVQARPAIEGAAISVAVGGPAEFCCHSGPPSFGYTAISRSDRLEIIPDAPGMLDIWRGRANIVIQDPLSFDWDRAGLEAYNFLNYNESHIKTLPLQFGLENRDADPLTVIGGYLEVMSSRVDRQPKLQSLELKPLSPQNVEFSIENYGWSTAGNAVLNASFQSNVTEQASAPFSIQIGEIASVHAFSFVPAIVANGLPEGRIEALATICQGGNGPSCLDQLKRDGQLGGLANYVVTGLNEYDPNLASGFGLRAAGMLSYDWTDDDGGAHRTEAPFEGLVPLGTFISRAECEGGELLEVAGGRPFQLDEHRDSYRIPFPLDATVYAGEVARWQITLDAAKSSNHALRIVLELADGREIASRDISVLMFRPNTYPATIRPFQPRC